jgi:hypothetical protein
MSDAPRVAAAVWQIINPDRPGAVVNNRSRVVVDLDVPSVGAARPVVEEFITKAGVAVLEVSPRSLIVAVEIEADSSIWPERKRRTGSRRRTFREEFRPHKPSACMALETASGPTEIPVPCPFSRPVLQRTSFA